MLGLVARNRVAYFTRSRTAPGLPRCPAAACAPLLQAPTNDLKAPYTRSTRGLLRAQYVANISWTLTIEGRRVPAFRTLHLNVY